MNGMIAMDSGVGLMEMKIGNLTKMDLWPKGLQA
jgi:hypothetical protein